MQATNAAGSFITRNELLDTFDNDLLFVKDLGSQFIEIAPLEVDHLRSLIAAGEGVAASRAAHLLKGMTGYFARGGAHTTAAFIEKTAATDLVAAGAALSELAEGISELRHYLKTEVLSCAAAS